MSKMDNFDKYVKEAIGNYSPALPEGAWERIFAERERRKPKGFVWFNKRNIAIMAALLFCTTGTIMLMQNKQPEESIVSSTNNNNLTDNTNSVTTTDELNKQNTPEADKTNAIELNETANKKESEANNKETVLNTRPVKDQNKIATAENNSNAGITNSKGKFFKPTRKKYFATMKSFSNQPVIDMDDDVAGNDNSGEGATFDQSFLNRLGFESGKINALSLKSLSSVKPNLKDISVTPCPQVELDAAGNKSYWEVYAGPDYAAKRFKDTSNSVYLQKVKAATTFSFAYSAGVRYTRVFNNGVSLRGGLNYSQVNEKFSILQNNIVQVNYIIDAVTGDTTGSYTVRGTRYRTTHNTYRTIDIPLTIGYEMGNGKFHSNINVGAMVNLYSWQKGETLDTSFQPVSITTGKGDKMYQYKTNIGIGFTAAASLYYKLNETMHILAEPYIRYNLSPMNRDKISLQEKFTTIGVRLGLRMDIP